MSKTQQEELNEQLLVAAKKGNLDQVEKLIKDGAAVDAKHFHGRTPLDCAIKSCHKDVVGVLLKKEANYSGYTPFLFAVVHNRVNVVKFLLENEICKIDSSALHHASTRGYAKMVRLLLERGADHNEVDGCGETSLHWAAKKIIQLTGVMIL